MTRLCSFSLRMNVLTSSWGKIHDSVQGDTFAGTTGHRTFRLRPNIYDKFSKPNWSYLIRCIVLAYWTYSNQCCRWSVWPPCLKEVQVLFNFWRNHEPWEKKSFTGKIGTTYTNRQPLQMMSCSKVKGAEVPLKFLKLYLKPKNAHHVIAQLQDTEYVVITHVHETNGASRQWFTTARTTG